jgi:hypothetical protein
MSSITTRVRRLVASLFSAPRIPADPETMTLRDWADLPPHHPLSDRAPC